MEALIEVGKRRFAVCLGGPGEPMEVETSTGERARFLPWRLADHLDALDRHVDAGGGEVRFDQQGFARDVLAYSGVPASLAEELAPLALWWAVGGEAGERGEAKEGWIEVGEARARLRRWTFAERERAFSASVVTRADGATDFKLARYLRAMLKASVAELYPAPLEALAGSAAAALLSAVCLLNADGEGETARLVREGGDAGKALAATTLRICRALGWLPAQVFAAPAAEIDCIVALLDAVEAPPIERWSTAARARSPRQPSLADYPDAVVIQVDNG